MSAGVFEYVESKGAKFAEPADAAGALIKIASDPSINGMTKFNALHCDITITDRFLQDDVSR